MVTAGAWRPYSRTGIKRRASHSPISAERETSYPRQRAMLMTTTPQASRRADRTGVATRDWGRAFTAETIGTKLVLEDTRADAAPSRFMASPIRKWFHIRYELAWGGHHDGSNQR